MKYIVAIIQPDRVDAVLDILEEKEIHLVTVTSVLGRGRQKGISAIYRSVKEAGNLLRKVKLEIAVNEDYLQTTLDAIIKGARTGEVGDGKIFVMNMEDCIRVRTGEHGREAIG